MDAIERVFLETVYVLKPDWNRKSIYVSAQKISATIAERFSCLARRCGARRSVRTFLRLNLGGDESTHRPSPILAASA